MPVTSKDNIVIDSDSNYFDTYEQIQIANQRHFVDGTYPTKLSGSTQAVNFFCGRRIRKNKGVFPSNMSHVDSVSNDASGTPRNILTGDTSWQSSSYFDKFRQGIEVTTDEYYFNSLVRISPGTPGDLLQQTLFGVGSNHVQSTDAYVELEVFDPKTYVESGGDPTVLNYPLVIKESNIDNISIYGIIEPLTIRPYIYGYSTHFPQEPHAFRGHVMNGNECSFFRLPMSDIVTGIDYFLPDKSNAAWYLDAPIQTGLESEDGGPIWHSGQSSGYVNLDVNLNPPFEDAIYPRDVSVSDTYDADMKAALYQMSPEKDAYISAKQKSARCGFVYNNTPEGTDSIAYGGLLY